MIKLDAPVHLPFVRGDHTQLEQVLSNLLDNACRHAGDGEDLRLRPRRTTRVAITVSDDGPGLPEAVRERMESGTPDASAGLGLGIVRAIVHLHGGTLALSDRGPGTSLTVSLPVAQ